MPIADDLNPDHNISSPSVVALQRVLHPIRLLLLLLVVASVAHADEPPLALGMWTPPRALRPSAFAASANAETLAFLDEEGTLRIWRPVTNVMHEARVGKLERPALTVSGNGKWLAVTSTLGPISIWNAETGKLVERYEDDPKLQLVAPLAVATADGFFITLPDPMSPAGRGHLFINGVATALPRFSGACILYLPTRNWVVVARDGNSQPAVAWHRDHTSCDVKKPFQLEVLDLATGKTLSHFDPPSETRESLRTHGAPFDRLALYASGDGRRLAINAGSLSVWDLQSGKKILVNPQWSIDDISDAPLPWSHNGRWLLVETKPNHSRILDVEKNMLTPSEAGFAVPGTNLFVGYDAKVTSLVDPAAKGKPTIFARGEIYGARITALLHDRWLVESSQGDVEVYDPRTGKRLAELPRFSDPRATADGTRIMSVEPSGKLTIWKTP